MKEVLLTSSVLILAVIALRWLFRNKVSRRLVYGVWLLVALRLLIPIQFGQLDFSVLTQAKPVTDAITQMAQTPVAGPSREEVYHDTLQDYIAQGQPVFIPEVQEQVESEIQHSGRPAVDVYDEILESHKPESVILPEVNHQIETVVSEKAAPSLGQIALWVWLAGIAVMAGWFFAVNLSLRRVLRRSGTDFPAESPVPVKVSAALSSPCLFGLFRPVIYLTPACTEEERHLRHVLTHEQTHLRHGDHIWAWVRCVCLCIYWFNPLVWVAAFLSKRDCELACDEAALKTLGEDERLAYGRTLVDLVASNPAPGQLLETATAMHETKKQLKERVNRIVKKPKVFLTAAIALLLVLTIVTGCAFSGAATLPNGDHGSTTPTTVPTDPTTVPTDPTTTPTEPPVTDEVAEFQKLLSPGYERSPYYYALSKEFSDPTELLLFYYFEDGFSGEKTATEAELAELRGLHGEDYVSRIKRFYRFPKDKMEAELQKYFGISLQDLPDRAFLWLTYLESSDSYCYTKTWVENYPSYYHVQRVEHMSDGTVRVEYTINSTEHKNVLTLKPNGEDYLILSNEHFVIDDPVLAKFHDLFESNEWERNPYFYAIGTEFSSPEELRLNQYFDGGFPGEHEITDAEWAELSKQLAYPEEVPGNFNRLPKDKIEAELQAVFGISLADLSDNAFSGVFYLECTDCYCFYQSGVNFSHMIGSFTDIHHNADGTLSLRYEKHDGAYTITLKPNGDSYLVLSNLPVSAQETPPPAYAPPLANIPIINQTAILPKNPTVEDLLLEPYTGSVLWFDEYGNEYDIDIELPLLGPFCDGAKAINEAIRNEFQSRIDQINDNYIARIGEFERTVYYEAYLNGNVLSVIITRDGALDHNAYHIYNLDISTGTQLTTLDMVQRYTDMDYPEFLLRATYTIYDQLNRPTPGIGYIINPLSGQTMRNLRLALNGSGELMLYNSYMNEFLCSIEVLFDHDAHEGDFSNWEEKAYRWIFSVAPKGNGGPECQLLADVFFQNPELFLKYGYSYSNFSTVAHALVFGLHYSQEDAFLAICTQWTQSEDLNIASVAQQLLNELDRLR